MEKTLPLALLLSIPSKMSENEAQQIPSRRSKQSRQQGKTTEKRVEVKEQPYHGARPSISHRVGSNLHYLSFFKFS